jgi:hypothetical protein
MSAATAPAPDVPAPVGEGRRHAWLVFALFVLALALRVAFFAGAQVDYPLRGDINDYVFYAYNLVEHGVFSSAPPADATPEPDAYRGPGYPAFLAMWIALNGPKGPWYEAAVAAQLVLGALLVPLAVAWVRPWLGRGPALGVGLLVACWPHLVVMSGTLLSETLFAVTLLGLLHLATRAGEGRRANAVGAGLVGGAAALVNPVAMLLPPIFAGVVALRRQRVAAAWLVAGWLVVVGAASVRNAMHPEMRGSWERAASNLVQGSWPQYHAAYQLAGREAGARAVMAAIVAEERKVAEDPRTGLRLMLGRLAQHPGAYARWYLLEKPSLLWDWDIRMGWGDVYVLETHRSPYERQAVFRAMHAFARRANPALFALALAMVAFVAVRWRRTGTPERLAVAAFAYLTVVHMVLQAEPRYAVAYRPIEFVLAVAAVAWLVAMVRGRAGRHATPADQTPG